MEMWWVGSIHADVQVLFVQMFSSPADWSTDWIWTFPADLFILAVFVLCSCCDRVGESSSELRSALHTLSVFVAVRCHFGVSMDVNSDLK